MLLVSRRSKTRQEAIYHHVEHGWWWYGSASLQEEIQRYEFR
jgi:hypothetical protein